MMLPRGLFIDMDGTLVDSEPLWLIAERALMEELGGTWTLADQQHCIGGPLERLIAYMVDKVQADSALVPSLERRLLGHVEAAFRSEPLRWQTHIVDVLDQARTAGIPAVLVTASDRILVDIVTEQLSQTVDFQPFAAVVAHGDTARGKPHPDPYLQAADHLAISARDGLAFEDSPTGVRAAIAAGCGVIAVPHLSPIGLPGAAEPGSFDGHDLASLWSLARDHRLED